MNKDKILYACDRIDETANEIDAATGWIAFKPELNKATEAIRREVNADPEEGE